MIGCFVLVLTIGRALDAAWSSVNHDFFFTKSPAAKCFDSYSAYFHCLDLPPTTQKILANQLRSSTTLHVSSH